MRKNRFFRNCFRKGRKLNGVGHHFYLKRLQQNAFLFLFIDNFNQLYCEQKR